MQEVGMQEIGMQKIGVTWWGAMLVAGLWACGGDGGADSGTGDGGTGSDTSSSDTSSSDTGGSDTSGSDTGGSDTGGSDAGGSDTGGGDTGPLDGLGALTGDCGVLDDELTDDGPSLFVSTLDLTGTTFDEELLSPGGLEIWEDENLGGSSLHSEVFAYEVLYRCEGAELLATESEILYTDPDGKKTDVLTRIDGIDIGVSVTRAYVWENDDDYTVAEATDLLERKLGDVLLSTANADPANAWEKQVLAVIAYAPDYAAAIEAAWPTLDPAVTADTILWVTVTEGEDEYIY